MQTICEENTVKPKRIRERIWEPDYDSLRKSGISRTPMRTPEGVLVVPVKGGTYVVPVAEVNKVLADNFTVSGSKLRSLVVNRSIGDDDKYLPEEDADKLIRETVDFYSDVTPFELAVVLAWYNTEEASS